MVCAKQAPRIATAHATAAFDAIRTLETLDDIRTISGKLH